MNRFERPILYKYPDTDFQGGSEQRNNEKLPGMEEVKRFIGNGLEQALGTERMALLYAEGRTPISTAHNTEKRRITSDFISPDGTTDVRQRIYYEVDDNNNKKIWAVRAQVRPFSHMDTRSLIGAVHPRVYVAFAEGDSDDESEGFERTKYVETHQPVTGLPLIEGIDSLRDYVARTVHIPDSLKTRHVIEKAHYRTDGKLLDRTVDWNITVPGQKGDSLFFFYNLRESLHVDPTTGQEQYVRMDSDVVMARR